VRIEVVEGDIRTIAADVMALKYANTVHGAAAMVNAIIGMHDMVSPGQVRVVKTDKLPTKSVVYIGVGPLTRFRYAEIREFGRQLVETLLTLSPPVPAEHVVTTSHGIGYGLDEDEAFLSLVAGLVEGATDRQTRGLPLPRLITIVEKHSKRAQRYTDLLRQQGWTAKIETIGSAAALETDFGVASESKPKLFAAMPFDDSFYDEYEIGFREAASASGFLCERLDLESYVGDVVAEIRNRIQASSGVLALMNGANANVFLEIGYAWAKDKPTILVIKRGEQPPFDVRGHRHLDYGSISELRAKLTSTIADLRANGTLKH
jgi:hypothetical protein